jgi:hypothetical protein
MKRGWKPGKGMIKNIVGIIYLILSLILTSALILGVRDYSEIQRAEVSVKAEITELEIKNDSRFVNISVYVLFSNPSAMEVYAYQIGVHLGIYNSTRDEVVDLGLLTSRLSLLPEKSEQIVMKLMIDRNTDNPRLRLGLDSMYLGRPGVERIWVLWGESNCYVIPSNFYFKVGINGVLRR